MSRSNSETSNEHNTVDKYFRAILKLVKTNQKNEKWGDKCFRIKEYSDKFNWTKTSNFLIDF